MAVSQSDLDEAYAQGQKDGASNRYKPPIGLWATIITPSDDQYALQESYDKGYEHGRSQR